MDLFKWNIDNDYSNFFITDDLPSAYEYKEQNATTIVYDRGIPVGYKDNGKYYIYNHLKFTVNVQTIDYTKNFYIVGFKVQPKS